MKTPWWVAQNLNIPTLVLCFGCFAGSVTFYVNTNRDIQDAKDYRVTRSKITDDRFDDLNKKIDAITSQNIPYRVTVNEQQIVAVNKRVDDMNAAVLAGFETLHKDLSDVSTNVAVLASKVDALTPRSNRSGYLDMPHAPRVVRTTVER